MGTAAGNKGEIGCASVVSTTPTSVRDAAKLIVRAIWVRTLRRKSCPMALSPSPLLLLFSACAAAAIEDSPGGSLCEVIAPRELEVFYEAKVPVRLRPADAEEHIRAEAVLLVLDGTVVATVSCSSASSLVLNHLAVGPHVMSLHPEDGAMTAASASSVRNVSFFVAAELFWHGHASPMRLHAAAQRDQCQHLDDNRVCSSKASTLGFPKLWVIMTAYNAARWIDKAISSLRQQLYCDFTCVIVDDASSDSSLEVAREAICHDPRFLIIANRARRGAAYNQRWALDPQFLSRAERAVEAMDGDDGVGPVDEDVVVWVDGDDWLYDASVLGHLASTYAADPDGSGCLMTYGSLVFFPYGLGPGCQCWV